MKKTPQGQHDKEIRDLYDSARVLRESGQGKINFPRLNKMRKRIENLSETVMGVGALSAAIAFFWFCLYAAEVGESTSERIWREGMAEKYPFENWEAPSTPKGHWRKFLGDLSYIMAPALLMLCIFIGAKKRADKREDLAKDAINLMFDLQENGSKINISPEKIEQLANRDFILEIMQGMSEAEAVWFEMLMSGDIEIAETPEFKNMAIAIMRGHLEKHPEAMEKILAKFGNDKSKLEEYAPDIRQYLSQRTY